MLGHKIHHSASSPSAVEVVVPPHLVVIKLYYSSLDLCILLFEAI